MAGNVQGSSGRPQALLGGALGAIRKLDQREGWGARLGLHLTSFPLTPARSLCFSLFPLLSTPSSSSSHLGPQT